MDKKNLVIFNFKYLYEILKELEDNLNLKIINVIEQKNLIEKFDDLKNQIIITRKYIDLDCNQLVLDKFPIKLPKLIEKLNIKFLTTEFNKKSQIMIGKYMIDLNSRVINFNDKVLKLTEKETQIIIFLSKSTNVVSIKRLQLEVWGYNSQLETHTVETHIYRLRKKILKIFNDDNFIISKKNGYQII